MNHREKVRQKLAALSSEDVLSLSKQTCHVAIDFLLRDPTIHYRNAKVAGYRAFKNELEPSELMKFFRQSGCELYFPRVQSETEIEMLAADPREDDQWEESKLGILEPKGDRTRIQPEDLDLIVVPGLVFDSNGNRIGRGKGYYDRYLAKCSNIQTLSVIYPFQVVRDIQPNEWEKPIDTVIYVMG